MNLLTQNGKLKETSKKLGLKIFNFSIPAYKTKSGKVTCPFADACVKYCYAQKGNYTRFPSVGVGMEKRYLATKSITFVPLMDKAIKSMLADLDPYTNYFNEQDVIKFKINNTGEYTGIGAMITRKEDKLIIKEPYKGFPADKAGLKAGDEITQIGDVLLADFKDDASQLMKGAKGTKINIKYLRQGKGYTTSIVLDEVAVKAVPFFGMVDDKTGYIVLSQFNQKASFETKEALEKLKESGALILGKANLSEWAYFFCGDCPSGYSAIGGQTLNPYGRRTMDTGGSSSGSGVAVASNFIC